MIRNAGESVVVARGGRGGMGVLRPTKQDNARMQQRKSRFLVRPAMSLFWHWSSLSEMPMNDFCPGRMTSALNNQGMCVTFNLNISSALLSKKAK